MSNRDTALFRNLPSMKALLFFNTVARHLNLVRAGEELHLTQGALSRQLKALENHLGVTLFHRGPRGLTFTPEGEILYDYSRRAFNTLGAGLRHLSVVAERETLVVSVARSFAIRVLAGRIAGFVRANPWVDLRVDIHRYFADLDSSGADISIRLGDGQWEGDRLQPLTDDALWLVAHPTTASALLCGAAAAGGVLLTNTERDYSEDWVASGRRGLAGQDTLTIRFNDSATMLEALHEGAGFCVTRACLVRDAVTAGTLVRIGDEEMNDGLRYFALCARRSSARKAVDLFMQWLAQEFGAAA